jgi:glycosyltransferase involved in cell wall biosynthesis
VPYKKVDLVVRVFNQLGLPLVVVGTGKEERRLRKIAKGNIRIVGEVGEDELGRLYSNAKAFVFPQEEDFGITAVEAQAHGVPVIAFKKAGALETVIHGKTGVFFEEQTVESLAEAVRNFGNLRFLRKDFVNNAKKFSKERFKREFEEIVGRLGKLG